MPVNTRRAAEYLMRPVEDSERIARGNTAGPSTAAVAAEARNIHPTGRDENASATSGMTQVLVAAEAAREANKGFAWRAQSPKEQRTDTFATVEGAFDVAGCTIGMALKKMDERVIDIAEQTVIDALESGDSDHNRVFVRREIRNVLQDLITSTVQDDTGSREAFEAAVVQVVGTSNLTNEVAKVIVSEATVLTLIGTFVVQMADMAFSRSVKSEVSAIPPSPPPSGSDNSSSESEKNRRKESKKSAKKSCRRRKSSRAPSSAVTW